MSLNRMLIALLAGTSALGAPTGAAAAPRSAQIVVHGSGRVIAYGARHPDGVRLTGRTLDTQHVYELRGVSATVRFGGATYRLSRGANFALSSYRFSRSDREAKPAIGLLVGRVAVQTGGKAPGGVTTEEGAYGPVARSARPTSFAVVRTLARGRVSTLDRVMFFAHDPLQPAGTTTVKAAGRPVVDITPYVGRRIGVSRRVHSARLTTTSHFGRGTATYSG